MDAGRPIRRQPIGPAIKWFAFAVSLMASFIAGAWIYPLYSRTAEKPPVVLTIATQTNGTSKTVPQQVDRGPIDPRQPEPRAVQARAAVIQRDAAGIVAECKRAAGGDWEKWQRNTAPYRANLKAKIDALKDRPESPSFAAEGRCEALEGRENFPLFEVGSRVHLDYLYDPGRLEQFRRDRLVVAADRWLRQRGIDLIFVPVPKMTEIYIEHFLDPCPPDGIIAPHMRHTLLELLTDNVEVVDGFALFRALRDADTEYLYNTADPHWAPRGMRIMAKEIADRIERYRFGARARYALPLVRTSPGPHLLHGSLGGIDSGGGWMALSAEQKARAQRAQTTNLSEVYLQDGSAPPDDPASPVIVIGHSYVPKFREQLIKELNLLIEAHILEGQTTGFFADFQREPESLEHCRVVVWITTEQHMTSFQRLPPSIMAALKTGK
jgi:hypothetical protein